jgi:multidrug transporter EmrE-like cation transporter
MKNIPLILISVSLNAVAQLLMRKGMLESGEVSFSYSFFKALPLMAGNLFLWIAMLCYGISILSWMIVLSKVEVSFAYPFLSVGYVLSALVGHFFMGESVTPIRAAGILIICAGVCLIARS